MARKIYRTLAEIFKALDEAGAPKEDPYLGFYTEQELADRWGHHVDTIRVRRRDRDISMPPHFISKNGVKPGVLYPRRAVWLFEMEKTFR